MTNPEWDDSERAQVRCEINEFINQTGVPPILLRRILEWIVKLDDRISALESPGLSDLEEQFDQEFPPNG